VIDNHRLDRSIEMIEVSAGERIYAYTDGVIEASNPHGALFGQERLEACLGQDEAAQQRFEAICERLWAFHDGGPQRDDLTLIEITCDATTAHAADTEAVAAPAVQAPLHWNMSLALGADTLRTVDPLPQIMQVLTEIQGLHEHRERLYTVLAELFSNALDHGLLGLDSAMKRTPQGFMTYYTAREQGLAALTQGWIKITLEHLALEGTGELTIRVEDSGPGFDYRAFTQSLSENTTYSGRGIPLVRALCKELTYHGVGNHAEAVYAWP
jgi:anti-sigma regulatory factor (Ser/Thr protein kinase)